MIFVISMINDETVHLPRFPFKINKQTNETRKKQKQRKNTEKQKNKNKKKAKRSQFVLNPIYIYFSIVLILVILFVREELYNFLSIQNMRGLQ